MVADAWTALQAASLARDDAAVAHERGEDIALHTTTAKQLAIAAAEQASDAGVQPGRRARPVLRQAVHRHRQRHQGAQGRRRLGGDHAQLHRPARAQGPRPRGPELSAGAEPRAARSSPRPGASRPAARHGRRPDHRSPTRSASPRAAPQQLLADGLRPGDRVALVAPTSTDYVITWLACVLAGAPGRAGQPDLSGRPASTRMLAPLAPALVLARGRDRPARSCRQGRRRPTCRGSAPTGSTSSRTCTRRARPVCRSSARRRTTTSAAWPRAMSARARPARRPTGCSPRSRCSTSTRWATASSPRCSPAPTR